MQVKVMFPRLGKLLVRPNAILVDFLIRHAVQPTNLPHGATRFNPDIDFPCADQDGTRFIQSVHCL